MPGPSSSSGAPRNRQTSNHDYSQPPLYSIAIPSDFTCFEANIVGVTTAFSPNIQFLGGSYVDAIQKAK